MDKSLPGEVEFSRDGFQALQDANEQNFELLQQQEEKITLQEQAIEEREAEIERLLELVKKQEKKIKKVKAKDKEEEILSPIKRSAQPASEEGSSTSHLPLKITQVEELVSKPVYKEVETLPVYPNPVVTVGDKTINIQIINSESKFEEVPKLKNLQDYSWYNKMSNYINIRRREEKWRVLM